MMLVGLHWMQFGAIACVLTLLFIYELSNSFKYYIKISIYYFMVTLGSIVTVIYSLLRPRRPENVQFASWLVKHFRGVFGLSVEVRGRENLKHDDPYIIVCNHQSSLDLIAMMDIWPEKCVAVAKKELLYAGPFGLSLYLIGTVFIDRSNKDKAVSAINKTSDEIKKKKVRVFVFPEGTRNNDGAMLPFKKGAFHLSVIAQVPIVPVVISSYSNFYSKREKKFTPGTITVTCLPKVSTKGLAADDVPKLMKFIRKQMLHVFSQT